MNAINRKPEATLRAILARRAKMQPAKIQPVTIKKSSNLKNTAAILGTAAATAVLFEVWLIPALVVVGVAAVPKLKRKIAGGQPLQHPLRSTHSRTPARLASSLALKPAYAIHTMDRNRLKIKQAAMKTVSFRVVASSIDFAINYLFIGELAAAAGLSAFALVALPILYFGHETVWNYFAAKAKQKEGRWGTSIELPFTLPPALLDKSKQQESRPVTVNLALTKALTYRVAATGLDFTANYIVIGDAASAAALSAIGLVIGPFIYFGHEVVWTRLSKPGKPAPTGAAPSASVPPLLSAPLPA